MKKLIHIAFGLALVFGMSSCEDYLDVNTDPDNPVSETVSPQLRHGVQPVCVPIRLPVS